MKLKHKIMLLLSFWLLCISLLANLAVYTLFLRIATKNEKETMTTKAEKIVTELTPEQLLGPGQESYLSLYLTDHSVIRTVDRQGQIRNTVADTAHDLSVPPKFTEAYETSLTKTNSVRVLTIRQPIYANQMPVGTLELSESLESLEGNIQLILFVLLSSTAAAVVLSAMTGFLLSRVILKPLGKLIAAMEEIESSPNLQFEPIPYPNRSKDELYKMTAAFNRMIERIDRSFEQQSRFVSDASHELKTTLTIIESYASILKRWGLTDREVEVEAIDTIYEEAIRMKRMTQQLLDLSAIQKTRGDLNLQQVDLLQLSRKVARTVSKLHVRDVVVDAPGDELRICADPGKIKQLLLILLDNAQKYSRRQIDLSVRDEGDFVKLGIRDYGIGIPKEEQPYIFDRFYRVDKARQRKTGGSGLGLAIAQEIVSEHEGGIAVESEEGKGTLITVTLPKEGPRSRKSSPGASAPKPSQAPDARNG
ncbi:sensor histidine kinase YkoH [Paenibacillus sp. J31TS4]|uniref:sensor histidine kinase n=1 Tax=Paenibacillus sp. J31TS4 TaxID=2807195 RepID=UPI001B2BD68C|nr:ATP-binding protein [Paenibacillus sp. J31TS4]GIP38136.1 sensor histidine kinase YkoH [Paenibacillus sp. J31TS4]